MRRKDKIQRTGPYLKTEEKFNLIHIFGTASPLDPASEARTAFRTILSHSSGGTMMSYKKNK